MEPVTHSKEVIARVDLILNRLASGTHIFFDEPDPNEVQISAIKILEQEGFIAYSNPKNKQSLVNITTKGRTILKNGGYRLFYELNNKQQEIDDLKAKLNFEKIQAEIYSDLRMKVYIKGIFVLLLIMTILYIVRWVFKG
jgi:hypothetical protein